MTTTDCSPPVWMVYPPGTGLNCAQSIDLSQLRIVRLVQHHHSVIVVAVAVLSSVASRGALTQLLKLNCLNIVGGSIRFLPSVSQCRQFITTTDRSFLLSPTAQSWFCTQLLCGIPWSRFGSKGLMVDYKATAFVLSARTNTITDSRRCTLQRFLQYPAGHSSSSTATPASSTLVVNSSLLFHHFTSLRSCH